MFPAEKPAGLTIQKHERPHTDAACCLEWRQEVKADYDTVGKAGEDSEKPTARLQ